MPEDDRDEEQRAVDAELGRDWREFHTSGPNCHWCYERPAAYVWCPWGTHVCAYCHDLVIKGQEWMIVETLAASMTVRGNFDRGIAQLIDPESFREHHNDVLNRWIEAKSHSHRISGEPVHDPRHVH